MMVDQEGANIVRAIRGVRCFIKDIARLLETTRDHLDNKGWRHRASTAISAPASLDSAEFWIPAWAGWFATNPEHPHYLLVLFVIFDSVRQPSAISEPLILSGCVRFAEPIGENWPMPFGWSKVAESVGLPSDGTFLPIAPVALPSTNGIDNAELSHAEFAGRPLVSITNAQELVESVLNPLLSKVGA